MFMCTYVCLHSMFGDMMRFTCVLLAQFTDCRFYTSILGCSWQWVSGYGSSTRTPHCVEATSWQVWLQCQLCKQGKSHTVEPVTCFGAPLYTVDRVYVCTLESYNLTIRGDSI